MKIFQNLCAAIVFCVIPFSVMEAKTVYVNNQIGNDQFSGAQEDNSVKGTGPVRTISQALQLAGHCDTISIANTGKPYQETLALSSSRNSGDAEFPFIIEGNGAVLDGRVKIDHTLWQYYRAVKTKKDGKEETIGDIFRLEIGKYFPNNVQYGMIYVDMCPIPNYPVGVYTPTGILLGEMEATIDNGWLYFRPEKGKRPDDYEIDITSLRVGITVTQVQFAVIRGLVIQGYQLDGVALANSAYDVLLDQCTVRGNGRAGYSIGSASRGTLKGCLINSNGMADVLTLPNSRISLLGCQLDGDFGPRWVDQSGSGDARATFYMDGKWIKAPTPEPGAQTEEKP